MTRRLFTLFILVVLVAAGLVPTAGNSQHQVSREGRGGAKLALGNASFPQERVMAVPLFFTAGEQTVGRINAQIELPNAAWKFRRAEPAKNSRLKVAAKQKTEEVREGAKNVRRTFIELTVSAGSRAIRNGVVAHLQFSLEQAGTAPPGVLSITKFETMPPVPEGATERPLPPPIEPPPPMVGCFFFTH